MHADRSSQPGVEVLILHNYADCWVPLEVWKERGPGLRWLLAPVAARDASTHKRLPLSVVPYRYRNTALSRLLIRFGFIEEPWPHLTR